MAHKTKAAMPGRQCNNTKHIQDTRLVAGGQSLGAPEITGTAPLARLGGMPVVGPTPFGYTNFSAHLQTTQALGCTALAHTPDKLRSFDRYLNSGYRCNDRCNVQHWRKCQPFGSIPCRRNSARANSFIQLPRLTPSRSATSFNCWRNSGLILIWKVGDQPSPLGVLSRLIVDTYVHNLITWILLCTYVNTSGIEKTTPQTVGAVLGRLTKPLTGVTIMAESQHTQTHPKFTWLFLATPKSHPDCSPVVLRFDTDTEENARAAFPGWEMVFAAKIRAEAPCRVAFFDYNTRRGWAFDSASDREVVGHD